MPFVLIVTLSRSAGTWKGKLIRVGAKVRRRGRGGTWLAGEREVAEAVQNFYGKCIKSKGAPHGGAKADHHSICAYCRHHQLSSIKYYSAIDSHRWKPSCGRLGPNMDNHSAR